MSQPLKYRGKQLGCH